MGEIVKGSIIRINLNPTMGHEQSGIRPAIVISGNTFHYSENYIIVPLTNKIKNIYGNPILVPDKINNLTDKSEILLNQIRTISHERVVDIIGNIDDKFLNKIYQGLDMLFDRG